MTSTECSKALGSLGELDLGRDSLRASLRADILISTSAARIAVRAQAVNATPPPMLVMVS